MDVFREGLIRNQAMTAGKRNMRSVAWKQWVPLKIFCGWHQSKLKTVEFVSAIILCCFVWSLWCCHDSEMKSSDATLRFVFIWLCKCGFWVDNYSTPVLCFQNGFCIQVCLIFCNFALFFSAPILDNSAPSHYEGLFTRPQTFLTFVSDAHQTHEDVRKTIKSRVWTLIYISQINISE